MKWALTTSLIVFAACGDDDAGGGRLDGSALDSSAPDSGSVQDSTVPQSDSGFDAAGSEADAGQDSSQPDAATAQDAMSPSDAAADSPPTDSGGGACLSGGNGGTRSDVLSQSHTGGGLSSSYHLYANLSAQMPGLMVFLHGDGAYSFENPDWILEDMVDVAKDADLITVAVRTPADDDTWWMEGFSHIEFLESLLQERVLDRYNIDLSRVLLVGYSGGGDFFSSFYIPFQEDAYCRRGALIIGGGDAPYDRRVPRMFSSTFTQSLRLHYYTGQDDEWLSNSEGGAMFYRERGFTVSEAHPAGVGHIDVPFVEVLQNQLAAGII